MSSGPEFLRSVPLTDGVADLTSREVRVGDRADRLTAREAELLGFFARRPGQTITRDELLEQVFGYSRTVVTRTVDSAISRLRAKIEVDPDQPGHLISVFGEGYRFVPTAAAVPRPVERLGVPPDRTSLVGRETEVAAILASLVDHRAVTLVGPGGVGKTRVAARVATAIAAERVLFVPLAHCSTAAEAVAGVGAALGARAEGARSADAASARVATGLAARETVLVLDNVEHLAGLPPILEGWLRDAPTVRILATSRAPIGYHAEHAIRVECLDLETAAALYVERATAAGARVGPGDLDAVRLLVARPDRLPLAVELAAARARSLHPDQLRDRLEAHPSVLSGGPRDAEPRLASLRATLDWSWDLLGADDRDALARLAVFPTRIGPDAARAVLGEAADRRMARLVEGSLVQPADGGHALLQTVRAWAREKAGELGVRDEAERAHAEHYAAWLAEIVPPELAVAPPLLDALEPELPHLLVVPRRMETAAPNLTIEVALRLWEPFQVRGPLEAYLDAVECAIRAARATGDPRLPEVLRARAMSRRLVGESAQADADLAEAEALAVDPRIRAWLGSERAMVFTDLGRFTEADAKFAAVVPLLDGVRGLMAGAAWASLRMLLGDAGADTETLLRASLAESERLGFGRLSTGIRATLGACW